MNLTERQLRMFTTTAALGNISRASEVLHISQPALTRALQEFESQLGVPLFARTTRRLNLTHEGERFLPVAQRLLSDMRQALLDLREQSSGLSGTVTLAVGTAFGSTVLPVALQRFAVSHPGVRLRVLDDNSAGITARVVRAEADLGIGTPVGDTRGLDCERLLSAPLGLLGDAARYRLTAHAGHRELARLPLLKEPSDTSVSQVLRAHGSELITLMERGTEVSSLSLQLALAHAGVGVAVLSALGASHPAAKGLHFAPLRPRLAREVFLMRRSDRAASPSCRALIDAIRATVATPPRGLHPLVKFT